MDVNDRYQLLLKSLLPKGHIWEIEEGSVLDHCLYAIAQGFARVDQRAQALLLEMLPTTATETLGEWKAFIEPALQGDLALTADIRQLIAFQMSEEFPFTKAALITYCKLLGYECETIDYRPPTQGPPSIDPEKALKINCTFQIKSQPGKETDTPRIVQRRKTQFENLIQQRLPATLSAFFKYKETP
jgi:hypothetical protein